MRRVSISKISGWSIFLALALLGGLTVHHLASILNLNQFRPQVTTLLENLFHCRVIVGNVRGELFPYPGLVVRRVALIDSNRPTRVLGSVGMVHLWLSKSSLSHHRLEFGIVRFQKPRYIVHREKSPQKPWTFLSLAPNRAHASKGGAVLDQFEVREGSIEFRDHTFTPTRRWTTHSVSGSFQLSTLTGALAGKAPELGANTLVNLRYTGPAAFPIEAKITDVDLLKLQGFLHTQIPQLSGVADVTVTVRVKPELDIRARLLPTIFPRLDNLRLQGQASFAHHDLIAHLQTGTTAPMTADIRGHFNSPAWSAQAIIDGYDATLVAYFYRQKWLDRLRGPGTLVASAEHRQTIGDWTWKASGKDFHVSDSELVVPQWSAQGDPRHLSIDVQLRSPSGGQAQIDWTKATGDPQSTLDVDLASFSVRDVLAIFGLAAKAPHVTKATFNPYGYEPWMISKGWLQASITRDAFQIIDSDAQLSGMHLETTGAFEFAPAGTRAHLKGRLETIPMTSLVESFTNEKSPISGTGFADFDLTFPVSAAWIAGMNGPLAIEIDDGVLGFLKTFYRVMSVLNLSTYLRLRLPQMSAEGIVFKILNGNVVVQNGVFSSGNLFLKSPNMNIGAIISLDVPAKRVDATLRLELFRFLEDILRDVPIIHWIFKKPNKIFLPLLVKVKGPWDDPTIF